MPTKKYSTILADPPWSINQKGKRGAVMHYQLMSLEDIKNIINNLKDELIIDYIILDKDNNLHITSNLKPHISAINKSYNLIEE